MLRPAPPRPMDQKMIVQDSAPDDNSRPRRPGLDWPRLALWLGGMALLGPALWNGFPILFFDTGGYIKRIVDWDLEPGRSFFYGLFLYVGSAGWFSLWGPVIAQAGATLWLIYLTLRAHGLGIGRWPLAVTTGCVAILLSAVTGVSWYVAQLMPDILLPLLVLCLWLLGFQWAALGVRERAGVAAIGLLALLSHMSGMALALGLVMVILVAGWLVRWRGWNLSPRLGPAALLVLASLIAMPTLHMALIGKPGFTPGGPVFIFGRLVQDGMAQRYLAEHCPLDGVKLCAYQETLPSTANDFIWRENSPFRQIGWWGGADAELSRLNRAIITAYPGQFVITSIAATGEQLIKVATGDGLDEFQEVTRWVFATMLPEQQNQAVRAARQQQKQTTQALFDALNLVHVPVAHLSGLSLLFIAFWGFRRGRHDLAGLALFVALALIGNAFINGALSNPHDRYQGRLVWLATLVPVMVGLALARRGSPSSPRPTGGRG